MDEADTTNRARVLIVEDDAAIARVLLRTLRKDGYDVDWAADGPAGLAAAIEQVPDLAMLDAALPSMGGVDVCRGLRAHASTRGMAIILLTGMNTVEQQAAALAAGADEFMAKPFHSDELRSRVRALIERKRRQVHDADEPTLRPTRP